MVIEGLCVADQLVVSALEIDADGHNRVWGLVDRATENDLVVTPLLQDLTTRGLTPARARMTRGHRWGEGLNQSRVRGLGGHALSQH